MGSVRRIVVVGPFAAPAAAALEADGFDLTALPGDVSQDVLVRELDGAWGLVYGGNALLSNVLWDRAPGLAAVCVMATGYRSFIELPGTRTETSFTYTPHANAAAVAEYALGLTLDLVRGITRSAAGLVRGAWLEETTGSLVGARLGVVGMGHVGREYARIAHAAFGADVHYWNRTGRPELQGLPYRAVAGLDELFEACDIVSLHLDLVRAQAGEPGNESLVGAAQLTLLGVQGLLVNASRAALVDPAALRDALAEGRIAGAAFDGYYTEPAPGTDDDPHGLLEFVPSRLLVTPHNAYNSHQAVRAMSEMAVANLRAVAEGTPPRHLIPQA